MSISEGVTRNTLNSVCVQFILGNHSITRVSFKINSCVVCIFVCIF